MPSYDKSLVIAPLVLSLLGARAPAHAGDAPSADAGAPREDRAVFSVGASLFAASYLGSVLAASHSYAGEADTKPVHTELYLPVIGPFQSIGAGRGATADTLLAADGLVQGVGLAFAVYAVLAPRHERPTRRIHVEPLAGVATGAQITGRF